MNAWITAIHRAFPGVQIAAVAADSNDVQGISQRRRTWNLDMLPALKGENALILHENEQVFDGSSPPATVLAMPYLHLQKLKTHELTLFRHDNLPVWLTAFNMVDHTADHAFQGTWLHGLFVAEQALLYLGQPSIVNVGLDASVGTVEEGFWRSRRCPRLRKRWTAHRATCPYCGGHDVGDGRGGLPWRLLRATPFSFPSAPTLGTTGAPALIGEDVTTKAGPEVILVNLSSQAVSLDLSAVFPGSRTVAEAQPPRSRRV